MAYVKLQDLRYGENPHQKAAFYKDPEATGGIAAAKQLHGKELSYNNIVDMEAAWDLAANGKTSRHASSSSTRTHAAPLLEAQLLKHSREPSTLTANLLSAASLP